MYMCWSGLGGKSFLHKNYKYELQVCNLYIIQCVHNIEQTFVAVFIHFEKNKKIMRVRQNKETVSSEFTKPWFLCKDIIKIVYISGNHFRLKKEHLMYCL